MIVPRNAIATVFAAAYSPFMDPALTVRAGRTAAMVMLLGGDGIAVTPEGKRLTASLDLSAGIELSRVAASESPDAAARVRLRKGCIRAWMQELHGRDHQTTRMLVVPGAGLDPLALDWCASHADAHAIELDHENVDQKRALIAQAADASIAERIQPIDCDLRDIIATTVALRQAGWQPDQPALWIFEGLTYYISHGELVALLRLALSGNSRSRAIVEFSGARDSLTPAARTATENYHRFIGTLLGGQDLTVTDIQAVARDADASIERLVCPAAIEESLGLPRTFDGPTASAMRIALLAPLVT